MQAVTLFSCSFHGNHGPPPPSSSLLSPSPSSISSSEWTSPGRYRLVLHTCNRACQLTPVHRNGHSNLQVTCNLSAAWQSLPPVWRVVVAGVGVACICLIGKQALQSGPKEKKGIPTVGMTGDGGSHVQMIVKGATSFQDHVGPWSVQDLTMGLAAMAKVSEKEPPPPPGRPVEELSKDAQFLACAQHWRAMAEAAYVCEGSSFSLQTQLPESALVHAEWNPDQQSLRPAYTVWIDGAYGAVVLSIRGTSHVIDMLVDSGAAAESFHGGQAHAGYVHGANVLLREVQPHLKKAFQQSSKQTKLVIVGHSMGAAIAVLAGFKLRDEYPDLQCWGFSSPACLSRDLAVESGQFAVSIMSAYDVVPRFSIAAVEKLRQQILDFDWEEAKRVLNGDPEWDKLQGVIDATQDLQQKVGKKAEGLKQQLPVAQQESGEDSTSKEGTKKRPPPALYPPGRLLILAASPPGCGKKPESRSNVPQQRNFGAYPTFEQSLVTKWALHEGQHEEFLELVVTPWGVSDHMLGNLCKGLGFLQRQCPPYLSCPSNLHYAA
ncbi:hypothetical protein L7F22_065956 [Adiantum nelumboides]|nr:hypothetical protein [Adiantum nelumboides]